MAETTYPVPVFHFQVDWGGKNMGFSEVSGLSVEIDKIEYRDGYSRDYGKLQIPGLPKSSNITLKRGVTTSDNEFYQWLSSTRMDKPERRDLVISLLNEEHSPVMTWKIKNAFPLKIEGPSLKSDGNEIAIESIELAHEGISIENN